MDVVLLSIGLVTVIGAFFAVVVIVSARRSGATVLNRQTVRRVTGKGPKRQPNVARRRRRMQAARARAAVDLTPLLSQGVDTTPRRRSLTRAS